MERQRLEKIYYSPAGYLKGTAAAGQIRKKIPKLSRQDIQHWLGRKPVYQIYKAKPKEVIYPHPLHSRQAESHPQGEFAVPAPWQEIQIHTDDSGHSFQI